MRVKWKEQVLDVSVTEFWMIKALSDRPGHVKSKDALMTAANLHCEDNTITSHIRRIRNKFKVLDSDFDQIETLNLAGYRWRPD
jgi:two-component system OmpR family response regulator